MVGKWSVGGGWVVGKWSADHLPTTFLLCSLFTITKVKNTTLTDCIHFMNAQCSNNRLETDVMRCNVPFKAVRGCHGNFPTYSR